MYVRKTTTVHEFPSRQIPNNIKLTWRKMTQRFKKRPFRTTIVVPSIDGASKDRFLLQVVANPKSGKFGYKVDGPNLHVFKAPKESFDRNAKYIAGAILKKHLNGGKVSVKAPETPKGASNSRSFINEGACDTVSCLLGDLISLFSESTNMVAQKKNKIATCPTEDEMDQMLSSVEEKLVEAGDKISGIRRIYPVLVKE